MVVRTDARCLNLWPTHRQSWKVILAMFQFHVRFGSILADIDEYFPRPSRVTGATQRSLVPFDLLSSSMSTCPAYQSARSRFGVELSDLGVLTNFNVGKSTIAIIAADPSRLITLLGRHQWSYLGFVPARYGYSKCLTAATDALLARVQHVLSPNKSFETNCGRLYGRALHTLQDALMDNKTAVEADVLAATQLIALHEVGRLNHIIGPSWLTRTSFSMVLIALHGPTTSKAQLVSSSIARLTASSPSTRRRFLQPMSGPSSRNAW